MRSSRSHGVTATTSSNRTPGLLGTFRKRTLVAYVIDESSGELVVNILGAFHGGQDWEASLADEPDGREAGR